LNAFVDSSVVLRIVLSEPKRLRAWSRITTPVGSELIRLECLRTIDRARLRLSLKDEDVANLRSQVLELLESFNLVAIDSVVLERAAEPFPTMLGSPDAIHLASAVLAREEFDDLVLATHDDELAIAARALGFDVHGSSAVG
jgi:predicted nucleic acid-binding protein